MSLEKRLALLKKERSFIQAQFDDPIITPANISVATRRLSAIRREIKSIQHLLSKSK